MDRRALKGLAAFAAALIAVAGPAVADGLAGPYLAATQADLRDDYDMAAEYYGRALLRDPSNRALLQNALIANIASGNYNEMRALAGQLQSNEPDNQLAALVMLAEAVKSGDFVRAGEIAAEDAYRLNPLFAGLMMGWADVGAGRYQDALTQFDALDLNDALRAYGQYHKALALALAGDYATAASILGGDGDPLHVDRNAIIAHVQSLSQSEQPDRALEVIDAALGDGYSDTELTDLRTRLAAGETLPFTVVTSAAEGAAAAFAIFANALAREEADRFGLVYARLATYLVPTNDEATILAAQILETQGQHEQAIATFAQIAPDSPWYIAAEIGRADALEAAGRIDPAVEVLSKLAREYPQNLNVQVALGDILRRHERFDAAADAYTRALALVDTPTAAHWVLYYSRGISHERSDRWTQAEADFRRALELQPDQPLVLNYLGYSLVELRRNLDEAQAMIEKAVAARPDDGYITDSLGWVLYRVGKYAEAVPHMERAVELLPIDPIINDHLGDVLWKVGRKREAEFQWRRALSFDPEETDAARLRRKLEVGLDVVLDEEARADSSDPAAAAAKDG